MTLFEEASNTITNAAKGLVTEKIKLTTSVNKVLQENIVADMDMPPFNKSAMDGYACRKEDLGNAMEILEVIQAGKLPVKKIGKNQCSKIMTGAAVPSGANCVFMIEDAELLKGGRVKCNNLNTKNNICFQAEDYKTGNILIKKGVRISPAHIGIMSGAGYTEVVAAKMPVVGIIATGTELVEPQKKPRPGQIRNSNAFQLMGQLQLMGIPYHYYGSITDDVEQITTRLIKSLQDNDIVLLTGGASNGDFDFVPSILKKQGFKILVRKTGLKPGNPMTFSIKNKKYCFGLSGNPVSSFVQFEFFVKPFMYAFMGCKHQPIRIKGTLSWDFYRKKSERFGIIPVKLTRNNKIENVNFHGSAHLNALAYANALMEVPEGVLQIKKGEEVYVRSI